MDSCAMHRGRNLGQGLANLLLLTSLLIDLRTRPRLDKDPGLL